MDFIEASNAGLPPDPKPSKPKPTKAPKPVESERFAPLNHYVDHIQQLASVGATAAFLHLWRHASKTNRVTRSLEQIAKDNPYGDRRAGLYVAELMTLGVVVRLSRGNRIKGASIYQLVIPSTRHIRAVDPTANGKVNRTDPDPRYRTDPDPLTEKKTRTAPADAGPTAQNGTSVYETRGVLSL